MRKKFDERIPRYTDLVVPTFQALKELGGSGKNDEILACVIQSLNLPDEVVDFPHNQSTSLSELSYQLAWARTYLKKYGLSPFFFLAHRLPVREHVSLTTLAGGPNCQGVSTIEQRPQLLP